MNKKVIIAIAGVVLLSYSLPLCILKIEKGGDFGLVLTGVSSFLGVFRYSIPIILAMYYKDLYEDQRLFEEFCEIAMDEPKSSLLRDMSYFIQVKDYSINNNMRNIYEGMPWYSTLIELDFNNRRMKVGTSTDKFEDLKSKIIEVGHFVAQHSTMGTPMRPDKFEELKTLLNDLCDLFFEVRDSIRTIPSIYLSIIDSNRTSSKYLESKTNIEK